jgi:transposase
LIEDIEFDALLGDKAFDKEGLRAASDQRGAVIPPQRDRARPISCDFEIYTWRHLVENLFGNSPQAFPPSCACWNLKPVPLKQWRRTATRTAKTDQRFA